MIPQHAAIRGRLDVEIAESKILDPISNARSCPSVAEYKPAIDPNDVDAKGPQQSPRDK